MGERSSDMTLAFTVEALRRLEQPDTAIDDAREWTEYVGVVAEEPNHGLQYTRERRVRVDFFSGTRSVEETLFTVGQTYATDRHVLVGTDADERTLAGRTGWEFREVEEAADRAEWRLRGESGSESDRPRWLDRFWPF